MLLEVSHKYLQYWLKLALFWDLTLEQAAAALGRTATAH